MPDVLVVADNADLRYLLEIALTLEGQAVETAVTRSDTTHGSGRRAGYEGSAPVRIGNAAAPQRQLDVYGEVMDALHQARRIGIPPDEEAWAVQRALLEWLEGGWREPDNGLWEVRGPARHFVHSKVMCWVAFDRAVSGVERFHLPGPVDRWRELRHEIHREVCEQGWDEHRQTFT